MSCKHFISNYWNPGQELGSWSMHLQKLGLHCGLEPFLSLTWMAVRVRCNVRERVDISTSFPAFSEPSPLSSLFLSLSIWGSWSWVPANRGVCSVWGSTHTAGVCWDHLYGFPPVTPVTSPPHLSLPPPPFPVPASGSALIILLWASDHNSCLDRCSGDENVRGERLKWGRERGASESSGGGGVIWLQ